MDARWLPFELHPQARIQQREQSEPRHRRPRANSIAARLAREAGLSLDPKRQAASTALAHSAAQFARNAGMFDVVHKALFTQYWGGVADLDDVTDLSQILEEAGLDANDFRQAVKEARYDAVLEQHRHTAAKIGVNGVPTHVIGRRYVLVGLQPYEVLKDLVSSCD